MRRRYRTSSRSYLCFVLSRRRRLEASCATTSSTSRRCRRQTSLSAPDVDFTSSTARRFVLKGGSIDIKELAFEGDLCSFLGDGGAPAPQISCLCACWALRRRAPVDPSDELARAGDPCIWRRSAPHLEKRSKRRRQMTQQGTLPHVAAHFVQ